MVTVPPDKTLSWIHILNVGNTTFKLLNCKVSHLFDLPCTFWMCLFAENIVQPLILIFMDDCATTLLKQWAIPFFGWAYVTLIDVVFCGSQTVIGCLFWCLVEGGLSCTASFSSVYELRWYTYRHVYSRCTGIQVFLKSMPFEWSIGMTWCNADHVVGTAGVWYPEVWINIWAVVSCSFQSFNQCLLTGFIQEHSSSMFWRCYKCRMDDNEYVIDPTPSCGWPPMVSGDGSSQ